MPVPLPRSITCLSTYSADDFLHDLIAGVTVGIVALPLAMAFAIASGLSPQAGIYSAVVTGFLISALGGADRLHVSGRELIFCGAREQPSAVMRRAEFHAHVGEANICPSIEAALARAAALHAGHRAAAG
jgi:MFS superfamily sulfate permease-like transporter